MNSIQHIGVGQTPLDSTATATIKWLAASALVIGSAVAGYSILEARKSDKYNENPIISYPDYRAKIVDSLVNDHGVERHIALWLINMPNENGIAITSDLYAMKIPSRQAAKYIVHLSELQRK